jgi:hypothetical protein
LLRPRGAMTGHCRGLVRLVSRGLTLAAGSDGSISEERLRDLDDERAGTAKGELFSSHEQALSLRVVSLPKQCMPVAIEKVHSTHVVRLTISVKSIILTFTFTFTFTFTSEVIPHQRSRRHVVILMRKHAASGFAFKYTT